MVCGSAMFSLGSFQRQVMLRHKQFFQSLTIMNQFPKIWLFFLPVMKSSYSDIIIKNWIYKLETDFMFALSCIVPKSEKKKKRIYFSPLYLPLTQNYFKGRCTLLII